MKDSIKALDWATAGLKAKSGAESNMKTRGHFSVECRDAEGNLRWFESNDNLVVTEGKNDMEAKYFSGSSYTAAFYVGLKGTGTALAADTMASHSSWSEITPYSNGTRPAFTAGTPVSGVVSNSASVAVFNINATSTIYGCFITTNNTTGGTTGILFAASDFSVSRAVLSGDTLSVTYTLTLT
jgi:hypothetical protein